MKFENRLILDEDQDVGMHLAGSRIVKARAAGSFGFSNAPAETDVIELRHALDELSESRSTSRDLYSQKSARHSRRSTFIAYGRTKQRRRTKRLNQNRLIQHKSTDPVLPKESAWRRTSRTHRAPIQSSTTF